MNKTLIWILVAVLAVGLFVGAYFLYDYLSGQATPALPDLGQTQATEDMEASDQETDSQLLLAPDFTVYDPEGKPVKLSELRGKPVVINLWTSWCIYCKQEMPDFEKLYEQYGQDVHFLMVNVTPADTRADAEKYIAESGYNFPVYYDTDGSLAENYYSGSVPTTYFLNAKGEAVTYVPGAVSADILEQGIQMIMQ